MPLRLSPTEADQSREAQISEIDELIASSTNPTFVDVAQAFRDKFQEGDKLFERCTSKSTWDSLMGWAGYEISRDGEIVESLMCRMN